MTITELIQFLTTQDFTDEQAYNLLTADIYDHTSPGQLVRAQTTIRYFEYTLREVIFPALRFLRPGGSAPDRPEIQYLANVNFTDDEAYELLTAGLRGALSSGQLAAEDGTILYFQRVLREVAFPAIRAAKAGETSGTRNVPRTNGHENVLEPEPSKDSLQAVQNGLDRLSGPEPGE